MKNEKQFPFREIIIDFLLSGLVLVVFALFHHALPRELPLATVTSAKAATYTNIESGYDGFTDKATKTKDGYSSKNIHITTNTYEKNGTVYYVQDIHIRYIECLRTAFAYDKYGVGFRDYTRNIARSNHAIAAISGDYYGAREIGVVVRNGKLYRESSFRDVCVLYKSGVMKTMKKNDFDCNAEMSKGAYQVWSFGPSLLIGGEKCVEFESDVTAKNPRCAIGYFEPGHYCFVVVDGRGMGGSAGMTLAELSAVMYDLGCKTAYNLDGGVTAVMTFDGNVVNMPKNGGRKVSDIICICEVSE